MKKQLVWLVFAVFMCAVFASPATAEKTIKWKAQSFWPSAVLGQKAFEDFCQKVKRMTNGRLEIKPYPAGAIVAYNEMLDQVQNNVLQAMYGWPGYWSGRDPAFSAISDLTAAWNDPWEIYQFHYYNGGIDFINELYKPYGVHCVGIILCAMEVLPSRVPLRGPDDFKGIKVRSPEGMLGDFLKSMGAGVVVLPGGEMYSALDKGVVDAGDWSSPALNMMSGLHKVAKYFNYPGFHSLPQGDFTVNKKEWEKLPDDIKAILEVAVREWGFDLSNRAFIADLEAVEMMKTEGAVPIKWSDENLAKARQLAEQVWDAWAAKSPKCKRAIELQKAWLKKIGR